MRRTKEEAEQTRKNLIRIGVHVFREKSFSATRLSDIAEAAGVTRGAIYHHFGSKTDLFKAVAFEHRDYFVRMFDDVANQEGINTVVALKQLIHTMFSKLVNDSYFRHFMEILIKTDLKKELPEIADIFGENKFEGYNRLVDHLENGKRQGYIKENLDTSMFGFYLIACIFGIISLWMENEGKMDLVKEADKLSDFIFAPLMAK